MLERGIILSTDIRSYISYKIVGATPGFIQYLQGIPPTGKDLVIVLVKSMFRPIEVLNTVYITSMFILPKCLYYLYVQATCFFKVLKDS